MKKTGISIQRGFTLVEAMVTAAVLVILVTLSVPGLQAFVSRSGMHAIRDDLSIALQRARMDAINRNTCVSVCQLADRSTDACASGKERGNWHQGWVVFVNADCSGSAPKAAIPAAALITVRQPGNPRFQVSEKSHAVIATFDPRGTLLGTMLSFNVQDEKNPDSDLARSITVTLQGRVGVAKLSSVTKKD